MKKDSFILGLLFLVTFILYNLNFTVVGSSDNLPARLLPFNIFMGRGIYLEDYVRFTDGRTYYFTDFSGHQISAYPLLMGIISLPVYFPADLVLNTLGLTDDASLFKFSFFLEKASASFFASLSVCLMYVLFRKISGNRKISVIFSLIFAFASQTFSISSQALWSHGGANLFMVLSLIFYVSGLKHISKRALYFLLALIFAVLSFWTRINFLLYLFIILLSIIWVDRKKLFLYLEIFVLGILVLLTFNYYFYSSFVGGYSKLVNMVDRSDLWTGFLGLLISPARGTLFYTPFFFFSLLSIIFLKKIREKKFDLYVFAPLFIYFIFGALLNFGWGSWWGGWSWGNRLLTDIAVAATILSYYFYRFIELKAIKVLFFIVVAYSIFAQILGVYFYPKTYWESTPNDVGDNKYRLWQLEDSPILRSLEVGPDLNGLTRAGKRVISF